MIETLGVLILGLTQLSFFKEIKTLKVKNYLYIVSFLITTLIFGVVCEFTITLLPLFLIMQTLLNLSFIDIRYLEVDPKSYKYLFIPSLIFGMMYSFPTNLFSVAIVFMIFFLAYKVKPSDSIGGADIKILLILSFNFILLDVFSLMFLTLTLNMLLFLMMALYLRRINDVHTPMIVSITLSFILMNFPLWLIVEKFSNIIM